MDVLPPRPLSPEEHDLEALIREARERQRRRRMLFAAVAAVLAAVGLSVWAAIPGRGGGDHAASGGPGPAATRGIGNAGRVPIVEVGTSGGVTWAINGVGMWLTTNGGRTWRASLPPHVSAMGDAIARVSQVEFFDRRHGWLLAVDVRGGLSSASRRHAELDWTNDGGRTWHWTMPAGCCGAVSFVSPSRGYSLGPTRLLSTRDGGATWRPVSRLPFSYGAPTFVDARHGVAVVGKGELFHTSDGGRRWTPVRLPASDLVLPQVAAFGRALVVPAERYVEGRDTFRLVVYASADGGSTWTARPAPRSWVPVIGSEDPREFSAVSASVWFAAGRRSLLVTRDAGRTWAVVRPTGLQAGWSLGRISFTSPRHGWAIFLAPAPRVRSVLMRTTDGGKHWQPAGPRRPPHHKHG